MEYEEFYLASKDQSVFLHSADLDTGQTIHDQIMSVANHLVNNTNDSTAIELEQLR